MLKSPAGTKSIFIPSLSETFSAPDDGGGATTVLVGAGAFDSAGGAVGGVVAVAAGRAVAGAGAAVAGAGGRVAAGVAGDPQPETIMHTMSKIARIKGLGFITFSFGFFGL
jgi:hypothetical protein